MKKRVIAFIVALLITASVPFACFAQDDTTEQEVEHCSFVEDDETKKDATCTEDGSVTVRCVAHTDCGNTFTKVFPKRGHDWSAWTPVEGKEPTCTEDGEEERTCQRDGCDVKETRSIPKFGHNMKAGEKVLASCLYGTYTPYTCQNNGCSFSYNEYDLTQSATDHTWVTTTSQEGNVLTVTCECSVCNKTHTKEVTVDEVHNYSVVSEDKAATCKEAGKIRITCDGTHKEGCTEFIEVETPMNANAHNYVTTKVDATCTTEGYVLSKCLNCENEIKTTLPTTAHAWDKGVVKTLATCTNTGVKIFTCSICGDTYTEVIAQKQHKFELINTVAPTCKNGGKSGYKVYKCTTCTATYNEITDDAISHNWSDWTVVQKATDDLYGIEKRTCSICNEEQFRMTNPIGDHTFVEDTETKKDATCTEDGSVTMKCTAHTDCGKTFIKTLPKLGHDWSEWSFSEGKNPTCTDDGEEVRTCKRNGCGASETRVVKALQHDMIIIRSIEKAENVDGYTDYKCSRCEFSYRSIDHNFEWQEKEHATCVAEGSRQQICSVCKAEGKEEKIEKTDHDYKWTVTKKATCKATGVKKQICSVCKAEGKAEKIKKTDHDYKWTVTKKATCKATGIKKQICSVCKAEGKTKKIAKTTHAYKWVISKRATCKATGTRKQVCSVCKVAGKTEKIAKAKHSYKWTTTQKAICNKNGSKNGTQKQICSVCKAVGKTRTIAPSHKWSKSGSQCTVCKKEDKFVKIKSIECTKTEFVVGEKWGDTKIIMAVEFENHTAKLVRTKAPKAFNTDKPTEESHPIKITFNYGGQTSKPIIIVVKAA